MSENNAMFTTHDWEWFRPPIYGMYGEIGDGLLLLYQHQ